MLHVEHRKIKKKISEKWLVILVLKCYTNALLLQAERQQISHVLGIWHSN
jgi:hypothetical protein